MDDPNNGAYMMILGQALFASGQYNEAAGETPTGRSNVVAGQMGDHRHQLQGALRQHRRLHLSASVLEKARDEKPNDPALHFLLGWQFGYLGYPTQSIRELDKTLELVPSDQVAKKVRDAMAEKLPKAELPPPAPVEIPAPSDVK